MAGARGLGVEQHRNCCNYLVRSVPPKLLAQAAAKANGAGEGNRTLVISFEGCIM
jgi:hypothetical protein